MENEHMLPFMGVILYYCQRCMLKTDYGMQFDFLYQETLTIIIFTSHMLPKTFQI